MPITVEELVASVLSLQERLAASEARCARLERENAELRARLGKNSSNWHKPTSSDSPYKVKPPGKKGKRKVGGQPGHKGVTRDWVAPEKVTARQVIRLPAGVCGTSLLGLPATNGTWSRQVVEISAIVPDVNDPHSSGPSGGSVHFRSLEA